MSVELKWKRNEIAISAAHSEDSSLAEEEEVEEQGVGGEGGQSRLLSVLKLIFQLAVIVGSVFLICSGYSILTQAEIRITMLRTCDARCHATGKLCEPLGSTPET